MKRTLFVRRSIELFDVYVFDSGKGFAVDYDLSTDGQPNDLTLQIRFFNNGNGGYNAFVDDCHV